MLIPSPAQTGAAPIAATDLSFENIRTALQAALGTDPDMDGDEDYPWVVDVFPMKSTFVYSCDGITYEQGFNVSDAGQITLVGVPRQVQSVTTYEPVQATFSAVGEDLIYEGEIFRAGNYPDKEVNATAQHLRDLVSKVSGVIQAKIQHTSTAFDKALETYGLEKVEARDNGDWLWGRVRLPKWVESALGKEFAVSVGLSKEGTTPVSIDELSIVNTGRIPTARIAAAFAEFAGSRHSKGDLADIQAMHDLAVKQGATCPMPAGAQMGATRQNDTRQNDSGQASSQPPKGKPMNLKERIKALFGKVDPKTLEEAGLTTADIDNAEFAAPAAPIDPVVAAQIAEFKATQEQMTADMERTKNALLRTTATQFADSVIADSRALPAQRASIVALFESAAKADGNGKVTFGEDNSVVEGENLKQLKALFEATPRHSMFASEIKGANQSGQIDPDRERKLLEMTPLGRKALAAKEGK